MAEQRASWYRWGRLLLYAEMLVATGITAFSLSVALGGVGFL